MNEESDGSGVGDGEVEGEGEVDSDDDGDGDGDGDVDGDGDEDGEGEGGVSAAEETTRKAARKATRTRFSKRPSRECIVGSSGHTVTTGVPMGEPAAAPCWAWLRNEGDGGGGAREVA